MINPQLKPWDIFNNHNRPDPTISGNVLLDGLEWYNSYMPGFFLSESSSMFTDAHRTHDTTAYQNYLSKLFSNQSINNTVHGLKKRVQDYFNHTEAILFEKEPANQDLTANLGYVLASLNLMQLYMDPIEAFTTNKQNSLYQIPNLPNQIDSLEQITNLPSTETAFIPLAVLINNDQVDDKTTQVFEYYLECFAVDTATLSESFTYVEKTFGYSKFMTTGTAKKLIEITANKIPNLNQMSSIQQICYTTQEINGIMTWSKYIMTNHDKNRRRYDSTNNILYKILEIPTLPSREVFKTQLVPQTTAGSEKQGMLIYLLNKLLTKNDSLSQEIVASATEYYNSVI